MKYKIWDGESLVFETNSEKSLMEYIYDLDDYERYTFMLHATLEGLFEIMPVSDLVYVPL